MDFLNSIKNNISQQTLNNLSSFFGENSENVTSGLNLSLNSFMAGLLKFSNSDVETKKIISVLNDGGHTGDILNNLEGFTSNFEKTQLLVTIGSNISNHFLGTKTTPIIDKISEIALIKKTSASSLLSLSAPIVLGFIGKEVKEKNLDVSGLRNLFRDMNDSVINAMPPTIGNVFQFRKASKNEEKATGSLNETTKKTNTNLSLIIPWVVLALAGLSCLYYYKFMKPTSEKTTILTETPVIEDKPKDVDPADFIPDTNVTKIEPYNRVDVPKPTEVVKTEPVKKEDIPVKEIVKVETPSTAKTVEKTKPVVKPTVVTPQKTVSAPVVSKKEVIEKPAKAWNDNSNNTNSTANESNSNSAIPAGWKSINGSLFRKNSAEISSESTLNNIVSQLKSSGSSIKIAPLSNGNSSMAEDRAYSLRDKLIEKGISEDQIEVSNKINGKENNQIAIKIIK
jgi:OmpA-OmpF porin, OOP family